MKEKEFYSQVRARFNARIKKLDKTSKDYVYKIYPYDPDDKTSAELEYNPFEYHEFIKNQFDEVGEQDAENKIIIIKDDFSAKINGEKIKNIFLKLGKYTRKENNNVEEFYYYESYREDAVLSVICKAEAFSKVIGDAVNPSKNERNTLLKFIKYSETLFDQAIKEKTYEWDWLKKYKPLYSIIIAPNDIQVIEECKNQKLFFTILGYSILAYAVGYDEDNEYDVCPLNIITDNESYNAVEKLIANCFIYTGEKDFNSIPKYSLSKASPEDFIGSRGRTIIIDTTRCQNTDTIKSKIKTLMPEFYPYLNQTTRKISYPYNYLPVFISKDRLGSQFINIDARGLKMSEVESLANVIPKLYEYPFYSVYMRFNDYIPVEQKSINKSYEIINKIAHNFKKWKKHFNISGKPYDLTLPKKYYKMMNLLRACCRTVSDFLDYWDDGQFLYQLEELIDIAFLPENLSDCNVNNKILSDFDISDSSEQMPEATQDESNFIKVLKGICDSSTNTRPQTKSEANSTAFLYNVNKFNAICFREEFFEDLVQKLSIDNYDWKIFLEDCKSNNLLEHNDNKWDIRVNIKGKTVVVYGLSIDKLKNLFPKQFNQAYTKNK